MNINKKQIAYNRSTRTQRVEYIVVHDTGNPSAGADAEANYKYFNGGDRSSSADFFVDDKQILQVNDYKKYYSWHCGDGHGKYGITNSNSVGVEICINKDGNYAKAVSNAVDAVKYLMAELGIDEDHVVRHYDASHKNCPATMHDSSWTSWKNFKRRLSESEGLTMTQYEELKQIIEAQSKEIDELKTAIGGTMIYNYIDSNMPDWAVPAVKAAVDSGSLQGSGENGELGLSYNDLRQITREYRAGLYN